MNIVFVSNFYNHHQAYISAALNRRCKEYRFIETSAISQERRALGWGCEEKPNFVLQSYLTASAEKQSEKWLNRAEVVICGSAPDQLIVPRLKAKQLTFKYCERLYKTGFPLKSFFRNAAAAWLHHGRFQRYPLYMLCASAYTAADCAKFGNYKNKSYKWGYFPETKIYPDVEKLICSKKPKTILWAGRFLNLKHPDAAIRLAKRLKENGCSFTLNLIGTGPMEGELKALVQSYQLKNDVHFLGAMKPAEVRAYMEQAQIYLFTSDKNEGWGAVLNEAMNSGCAVVASHAIGSVPFLLGNQKNGLIYKNGDEEDLFQKVLRLLNSQDLCFNYGRQAYLTITTEWNAETAAERFVMLSNAILSGNKSPNLFSSGPCSRAKVLADDWFTK